MTDFLVAYRALAELMILSAGFAFSQFVVLRAGVFALSTAAFGAVGAYAGAILVMRAGWHPLLAAAAATALGAMTGLALALPLSRLRGPFQAIATVAFVQIVVSLALYAEPLTGGALGLNGIPQSARLPILLVFFVALCVAMEVLVRSGIGRAFDAIRQDETVAVSLGISVTHYHRVAFIISGAVAGLTGCLFAFNTHSIAPEQFGFSMLVAALTGVVLGGRVSVAGPVIGVAILSILPEVARPVADQRLIVQGALLIAVMVFLPAGVADTARAIWASRRAAHRARTGERGEARRELPVA